MLIVDHHFVPSWMDGFDLAGQKQPMTRENDESQTEANTKRYHLGKIFLLGKRFLLTRNSFQSHPLFSHFRRTHEYEGKGVVWCSC